MRRLGQLIIVCFLSVIITLEVEAITCYVCSPNNNNLCHPLELYGNKTECPKGVNVCYKSWSVEADPQTVRRCGSPVDIPNKGACKERLQGANKVLVCKCDKDLCNSSLNLSASWPLMLVLLTLFKLC